MAATQLTQEWIPETIVLSYVIAVTGSFCTIQIMEQWRVQENPRQRRILLLLASIALGGCGIWAMHFTGMQAQRIYHTTDGSRVRVDFEGGMTVLSLLFPIAGVFVGLLVASRDPFFLEMELSRRKAMLADRMRTMSITEMLNKSAVQRKIKFIALFSRPWRILMGGLWAALGVLSMHYLGMMGQRSVLTMRFDGGLVAVSCIIAFVAATAAFWIIFRALTFWPSVDTLRIASALAMGVAVCGTHYTGMAAARMEYDDDSHGVASGGSGFVIEGDAVFRIASNGSLVLCFWLVSLSVVRDLRVSIASSSRGNSQPHTNNSNNNSSGGAMKHEDNHAIVQPFHHHNGAVPRNSVKPVVAGSPHLGAVKVDASNKSTVVARLKQKQLPPQVPTLQPDVVETETNGEILPSLDVVPGRV